MSSHCTGAPPSKISSRITCASFGSTPFKTGTFLVGVLLLLLVVVGVPGRLIGEPFPGTDNCLFTDGGVEDGLIGMALWQGWIGVDLPIFRGNVWLLLKGVPVIRLPGTDNFLPDAETILLLQ